MFMVLFLLVVFGLIGMAVLVTPAAEKQRAERRRARLAADIPRVRAELAVEREQKKSLFEFYKWTLPTREVYELLYDEPELRHMLRNSLGSLWPELERWWAQQPYHP